MIISFADALNKLTKHEFETQIKHIAKQTFDQWYETYYKDHYELYPNAEHIANNFMNVACGLKDDIIYDGFIYFNLSNNKIAGIITLNKDELAPCNNNMFICINNVFVLPEYRGQGIARKLVKFLMYWANRNYSHVNQINLFCEKHLIDFYKSLGWLLVDECPRLKYWYEMIWKFDGDLMLKSYI